jgi:hypothetical protein
MGSACMSPALPYEASGMNLAMSAVQGAVLNVQSPAVAEQEP